LGSPVDPITALNGRPRVGDQLVRIDAFGAAELRDHVRVVLSVIAGLRPELLGELDDGQPALLDARLAKL